MTYILGFSHNGVNSIICDARVTSQNGDGRNTSLKSGLFFPGCMFGRAGNLATSRDFVVAAKVALSGRNTLPGFWQQFEEFVSFYDMPVAQTAEHGRFQLLLSTRCFGKPRFYLFDSYQKQLNLVSSNWVSIGSGKVLLDPLVEHAYSLRLHDISQVIESQKLPPHIYPYFLSTWLSELTLSVDKPQLEHIGVGGVFHFCFQGDKGEAMQEPTLYVISDADIKNQQINCWIYRVTYVQGCVIVETLIPPGQNRDIPEGKHERWAYCDEAARPDIGDKLSDDAFLERMRDEINELPFYVFCGFGFANPTFRKGFGFHITTERKYAVTPNGEIADEYKQLIASHFE